MACVRRFYLLIQNKGALHRQELQIVHVNGRALGDRLCPGSFLHFLLQHGFEGGQNLGFVVSEQ